MKGKAVLSSLRVLLLACTAAASVAFPSVASTFGSVVALMVLVASRPLTIRVRPVILALVAFVFWMVVLGLCMGGSSSIGAVLPWVSGCLFFVTIVHCTRSFSDLFSLILGYTVGSIFSAFRLVFELGFPSDSGGVRIGTVFDGLNVNYVAYSLAAAIPLVFFGADLARGFGVIGRWFWIFAGVSVGVGLYLTQTRGAIIGSGVAVLWIFVSKVFGTKTLTFPTLAGLGFAVVTVSGLGLQSVIWIEAGARSTGDWSGRFVLWEAARSLWSARPLFGYGLGTFGNESGYGIAAHNIVLDLAVQAGVVGVCLFVLFVYYAVWSSSRQMPVRTRADIIGCFILAVIPAYLTGVWGESPSGWIALGIIAAAGGVYKAERLALQP